MCRRIAHCASKAYLTSTSRGSFMELTFSKDNFQDVSCRFTTDQGNQVFTTDGLWPNIKGFPVVMISSVTPESLLAHFNSAISYAEYPIADAIALPNLATDGRSGDILHRQGCERSDDFSPGYAVPHAGKTAPARDQRPGRPRSQGPGYSAPYHAAYSRAGSIYSH